MSARRIIAFTLAAAGGAAIHYVPIFGLILVQAALWLALNDPAP